MSSTLASIANSNASATTSAAEYGAITNAHLYRSIVTCKHPGWSWAVAASRHSSTRFRGLAGGVKNRNAS